MVENSSSEPQRRVLFILPDLDVPPIKGYQVRCLALADGLSERYVARVVASRSTSAGDSVGADRRPVRRLLSLLECLVRRAPLQSAIFDGRDVSQRFREVVEMWRPDAIVVVTERLPWTTAGLRTETLLVDVVDSMRIHMNERAARASRLARLLWAYEARAFTRNSRGILRCARHVVVASNSALHDYPAANVIENAARLDRSLRPAATIDVVFTGNLSYWPNVKAAIELCERVAPRIRRVLPAAVIAIAGSQPTLAVQEACAVAGVTLMANVEDMAAVLRASRLALVPVEWTPGANLKILEALAAGTPVMAYASAAQQLPENIDGVRICDGPDAMAHAAIAFLQGRELHAVRRREQHTWTARSAQLEALLDATLSDASAQAKRG